MRMVFTYLLRQSSVLRLTPLLNLALSMAVSVATLNALGQAVLKGGAKLKGSGIVVGSDPSKQLYANFGTKTFSTPGSYQFYATTTMTVKVTMWGAGGGGAGPTNPYSVSGGGGGYTKGNVQLKAGTSYYIWVGSGGSVGEYFANGSDSYNDGGYGGDYSGLFANSVSQANSIAIAGGGGGAVYQYNGGGGGG